MKLAQLMMVCFVVGVVLLMGYRAYGFMCLTREVKQTERDAESGVVLGTEARTLEAVRADDRASTHAVLLIHGFCGSPLDFGELPERLAEAGLHVRVMRLPGHGTTPQDFAAQSPESLLAGAREEFEALAGEFDRVSVVGFSMGGAIATLLAAEEPRVERLVLMAPYYGVRYRWFYVLPAEWWNTALGWATPYVIKMKGFRGINRKSARDDYYTYRAIPMKGVRACLRLGRRASKEAVLGALEMPVLLLVAPGDMVISPKQARRAFGRIGSGEKVLAEDFPRSNHMMCLDYNRKHVRETVAGFLTLTTGTEKLVSDI